MTKKIKVERISLSVGQTAVLLDYEDKGYYLGAIEIGGVSFHVEALAVKVKEPKIFINGEYRRAKAIVTAKNPDLQNRIDNWQENNDTMTPKLVETADGMYFVHIEVYAA